ncbi:MAG: hypothetical protein GYB66_16705 [Chloroflexi bacterium]|nr:hypothetical protein [Chloroflexota bacterium]
MRKHIAIIAIIITIVLFGLVVLRLPGHAQPSDDAVVARMAMPAPDNLEPTDLSRFDPHKRDLLENLLVGLTRLDAQTGQVEPWLATEWDVSPDGLSWTFALRDDIQWIEMVDGEPVPRRPVVAGDFVFAIQRACDPNRPTPLTANLLLIDGCRVTANALDTWRIDQTFLDTTIGVRAIDDQTLVIDLVLPAGYFLTLTALPEFRPLPQEDLEGDAVWPFGSAFLTNGPWVVVEWNETGMRLAQNPFWPIERAGNVDEVQIQFGIPEETVPLRLTSGSLEVARIPPQSADTVRLAGGDLLRTADGTTAYLLGFSFEYPPLDNPLFRQALAQAINREQLARMVSAQDADNVYRAMQRFTPRNVVATPATAGLGFDPAAAQEALAEADYTACNGVGGPIDVVVEDSPATLALGQFVVQQWQVNLGCEGIFRVSTAPRQALVNTAHRTIDASAESEARRFPIWLVTWTADYPDANAWTNDALHCQFGFLQPGRTCELSDTLLEQAAAAIDIQTRFTTYTSAEDSFFGPGGSFPVIPLLMTQAYWGQQSWVDGVMDYGPFQFDRWTIAVE